MKAGETGGGRGRDASDVARRPAVKTIVAIGEAVWDAFPDGRRPGGAPCNVAFHATRLGDRGVIVTRVGTDPAGAELVAFLRAGGVETHAVQRDPHRPTGTVSVTIVGSEARYEIPDAVAWDHLAVDDAARRLVRAADAVCVGSLAQRRPATHVAIHELLAEARARALVVFDVNLRPPFVDRDAIQATVSMSHVVKMNESEAARLAVVLGRPHLVDWMVEEVGVRAVYVTGGSAGASVRTVAGSVAIPGTAIAAPAGDVVGAGDAFTAAIARRLVRHATPDDALAAANRYAALVAGKPGAMPAISAEEVAGLGL